MNAPTNPHPDGRTVALRATSDVTGSGVTGSGHTLIFTCTRGSDDPERATLPFVAANVAATAGQPAVVLCTSDAVVLGTRGGADGVIAPALPLLATLLPELLAGGGQVWLCGASTTPRGITEADLIDGVQIVGAARIVEELASGAGTFAFS